MTTIEVTANQQHYSEAQSNLQISKIKTSFLENLNRNMPLGLDIEVTANWNQYSEAQSNLRLPSIISSHPKNWGENS